MLDTRSVFSAYMYLHGPHLYVLSGALVSVSPTFRTHPAPRSRLSLTSSWPLREVGGGNEKLMGWEKMPMSSDLL